MANEKKVFSRKPVGLPGTHAILRCVHQGQQEGVRSSLCPSGASVRETWPPKACSLSPEAQNRDVPRMPPVLSSNVWMLFSKDVGM